MLFVGNSHLFVNNVPERVRIRLQAERGETTVRAVTQGGARLISFTYRKDVQSLLTEQHWDVVVLQEASVSFLAATGRKSFHAAVNWFARRVSKDSRIVLYQTWPWRDGSRYLARTSFTSAAMWRAMQRAYAKHEGRLDLTIAPVGTCWVNSKARANFYSEDGNHASVAGSQFAADVIARTILLGRRVGC